MENLSKQDQDFVKEVALTGNLTASAKKAYGIEDNNYAGVKANRKIRNDKIDTAIQEVKRSLAERISEDRLHEVLMEGLEATKSQGVGGMAMNISKNGIDSVGHTDMFVADYPTRHKYLDTALKLKGLYETDEQKNINILMPVLVKFLDIKDDTTSDNGDTE